MKNKNLIIIIIVLCFIFSNKIINAEELDNMQQLLPKRYTFGNQLENLKYSLSNPLEQYTGIVFIGDSITWGRTLEENTNGFEIGRDGTLSDIRDNYKSPSYVNNFKRYIGEKYAFNSHINILNWENSTKGESIVIFEKQNILYPYQGDFDYTTTGAVIASVSRSMSQSLSGSQLVTTVDSKSVGEGVLSFPFTGNGFTLSFDSLENSMDYELIIDGVSKGVFNTAPGNGITVGFDQRRTHEFDYIRNKKVEIKTKKTNVDGYQQLNIGGIIINKKIRISNQGIIGQSAKNYKKNNMSQNTSGDGIAVDAYDNYVFVQLGTNDRIINTVEYPKGSNEFKNNLQVLLDELKASANVILMVANPVANEDPTIYSFNMQDVRSVIYMLASENNIDFIDNYSAFDDMDINTYTSDGLHPNKLGQQIISNNIINSLEFK